MRFTSSAFLLVTLLAACGSEPIRPSCQPARVTRPWLDLGIPAKDGTACKASDQWVVVQHQRPSGGVPAVRDIYLAALTNAGWTDREVVTDRPTEFGGDVSKPGRRFTIALTISEKSGLIEVQANLASRDWGPSEAEREQEAIRQREHDRVTRELDRLGK